MNTVTVEDLTANFFPILSPYLFAIFSLLLALFQSLFSRLPAPALMFMFLSSSRGWTHIDPSELCHKYIILYIYIQKSRIETR